METIVNKNMEEKVLAITHCDYKWHYKNHEEFRKAFDNDEFGLTTMVCFYPKHIYLENNYDYPEKLPKNVITCMKITWEDWVVINNNNEITSFWDWEEPEVNGDE